MIPESGSHFPEKIMPQQTEHDPEPQVRVSEKWKPLSGKP